MIKGNYYIKYIATQVCAYLLDNINDNFKSVSFEMVGDTCIVKFVLSKLTGEEQEYIDLFYQDLSGDEQEDEYYKIFNDPLKIITEVGNNISTLKHVVYKQV